jgi:hypothetical protein
MFLTVTLLICVTCTARGLSSVFAILTKWFSSTRLETRTKESNIYASIWVFKTLMRNESKGALAVLRLEPFLRGGCTIDRSF